MLRRGLPPGRGKQRAERMAKGADGPAGGADNCGGAARRGNSCEVLDVGRPHVASWAETELVLAADLGSHSVGTR